MPRKVEMIECKEQTMLDNVIKIMVACEIADQTRTKQVPLVSLCALLFLS